MTPLQASSTEPRKIRTAGELLWNKIFKNRPFDGCVCMRRHTHIRKQHAKLAQWFCIYRNSTPNWHNDFAYTRATHKIGTKPPAITDNKQVIPAGFVPYLIAGSIYAQSLCKNPEWHLYMHNLCAKFLSCTYICTILNPFLNFPFRIPYSWFRILNSWFRIPHS